jgi:hypothetical protein
MEVLRVDFYSGSKGDETPRKIYTPSGTIIVDRIIETKLEENLHTKKRTKTFVFQCKEKNFYQLNIQQESFELKQIKTREE